MRGCAVLAELRRINVEECRDTEEKFFEEIAGVVGNGGAGGRSNGRGGGDDSEPFSVP